MNAAKTGISAFLLLALVSLASCGLARSPEPERRHLRLVINADTVQYVQGNTLTLSITAHNINSKPITVIRGGLVMRLWPEPTGYLDGDVSGLCGTPAPDAMDTVHLEPADSATFDVRFAPCSYSTPMHNGPYVLGYKVTMKWPPEPYRVSDYSENSVVVVVDSVGGATKQR